MSLAEIDKMIVAGQCKQLKGCNYKPAMMRAYKKTTKGGDGFVRPHQLPDLIQNIYFFNKV